MANTQKTQEKKPSRGRLLRSPDDRILAGVAGGTAKYLGIDATLVRLAFALTTFFGGIGLIAYAVMAVVVPRDDGTGNPVPRDGETGERVVRFLAVGLIAIIAIGGALALAALAAFATATGSGAIVAGVVIALGVGLAAAALIGEGAKRAAPWLLAVALILAVPAGAVAAADVRFDGGIGERNYSPSTVADIPADGYELGVGQIKLDLRELDVAPGETVEVPAKLGLGQLLIGVPSGVCVTGEAQAKGGDLLVRGERNDGVNPEFERASVPGKDLPEIKIDAELQFGQLVVTDRDLDEFDDDRGPGPGRDDEFDEIAPEPEGCPG